jgi:hypothetical protein
LKKTEVGIFPFARYNLNVRRSASPTASVFIAGCIAFFAHCQPSAAQSFSYEGALRYSQGKYTLDETVTSAFWLNEFSYSSRGWWAEAVVPVIYQDSADVRYVGGMPMPVGGHHEGGGGGGGGHHGGGGGGGMPGHPEPPTQDFEKFGIGDLYLTFGAVFYRDVFDRNSLGAFVTAKAPLADESRGFGSGEWDFAAGVSWYRRTQKNLFFAELAYWSLGEPPDVVLINPVAFEFAYGRVLSNPRYLIEASIWGRTETIEGVDGPVAIDLTLSRGLKRQHSVYFTAEVGLTESAPDFAVVFGYRTRIWR